MSQFRQDNRFTGGMSGDINDLNQSARTYKKAINLFSRDEGNLTSKVREKSDLAISWSQYPDDEPDDYSWVAAFRVPAFDPNGVEKEWIVAFMKLPTGGAIYQIDPDLPSRIHRLHDDRLTPAIYDRNDPLVFDKDMDASVYREGDNSYVFWTSKGSRPRSIVLVSDQSSLTQHDVSAVAGEFMGVANVADCLYVQPLCTNDTVRIVTHEEGSLPCGVYQYAYRYVNTNSGKVSRISQLSALHTVLPSLPSQLNSYTGGGPGQISNQGAAVRIYNGAGYHRSFFNAVQFYQIYWTGNSEATVSVSGVEEVNPLWYGTNPGSFMERIFTGSEEMSVYTMDQLLEVSANIEEACVLEERDGRLYLGNIKYSDLKSGMSWQNDISDVTKALTTFVTGDYTSIDPLTGDSSQQVQYPIGQFKGYRGGEVYRFGITYWNKFGEYSEPDTMKFTGDRRTLANHASGGAQYNWADASSTDWKFPERYTNETSIMSALNSTRAWNLEVVVPTVPEWAFGFSVVRRETIKNIIAQTPIINAMSINGSYSHADPEIADDVSILERPWLARGNYDTSGEDDTFEPKVLSYGATKSVSVKWHSGSVNSKKRLFYPLLTRDKEREFSGLNINTSGSRNSLLYLYPLEYLANDNGEALETSDLNGAYLEIIDCVMCTAYNAARTQAVRDALSGANVIQGAAAQYVWLFAPEDGDKYWSKNNTSATPIWQRGTNAYDGGLPVGPQRVKIGSVWTIGFGSLPTVIGEGYSDDETVSHISKANGLSDLWSSQAANSSGVFKNADFRYPGQITNQRAILVSQLPTSDTIPVIQDPTEYIYTNFQNGSGDYNKFTGPSGAPTISTNAVTGSTDPVDPSNITSIENPFMIAPDSGLPIMIANITRNLPDNRYDKEGSQRWISTGNAEPLTKTLVQFLNNSLFEIPVQVLGGDVFVTRATIKIRDNAPIINSAEVSDEEDTNSNRKFLQYQGGYGDTVAVNGDRVGRVTGYESYVEYLQLWVESSVNGFWFSRPDDSYPTGFSGRSGLSSDTVTYPDFLHDDTIINKCLSPITYLYNFAYSNATDPRIYFSGLNVRDDVLNPFSRIHYTPQRIYEEWEFPFQRWLTGDYHDLPRSSGPITRLVNVGNDRMVALQVDDVQMLYMGIAVAEDQDGSTFTLQSSRVVGSDASMVGESSKFVAAGAYVPGESILTPFGLFFYDRRRNQVFQVSGGVNSISDNFVQSLLKDEFIAAADVDNGSQYNPRMFYEHSKRRLWLTNWNNTVGEFRGICYDCQSQRWETIVHITDQQAAKEINAIVSTGKGEIVFADNGTTGEIYDRRKGSDFGGMFGSSVQSSLTFVLNNTEHSAMAKVLKTVQVQGDTAPASVQAIVKRLDIAEQDSGIVLLAKERRGTFLFSNFRDSAQAGTRIRGEQIEVTVNYSGTAKTSLESVQTTYRLDHRSKLR